MKGDFLKKCNEWRSELMETYSGILMSVGWMMWRMRSMRGASVCRRRKTERGIWVNWDRMWMDDTNPGLRRFPPVAVLLWDDIARGVAALKRLGLAVDTGLWVFSWPRKYALAGPFWAECLGWVWACGEECMLILSSTTLLRCIVNYVFVYCHQTVTWRKEMPKGWESWGSWLSSAVTN